jgi:hypothetical protein
LTWRGTAGGKSASRPERIHEANEKESRARISRDPTTLQVWMKEASDRKAALTVSTPSSHHRSARADHFL